jgi:hypothetical protein
MINILKTTHTWGLAPMGVNNVTARVNKTRLQLKWKIEKEKSFDINFQWLMAPVTQCVKKKADDIAWLNCAVSDAPALISLQTTNGLDIHFTLYMKCGQILTN